MVLAPVLRGKKLRIFPVLLLQLLGLKISDDWTGIFSETESLTRRSWLFGLNRVSSVNSELWWEIALCVGRNFSSSRKEVTGVLGDVNLLARSLKFLILGQWIIFFFFSRFYSNRELRCLIFPSFHGLKVLNWSQVSNSATCQKSTMLYTAVRLFCKHSRFGSASSLRPSGITPGCNFAILIGF